MSGGTVHLDVGRSRAACSRPRAVLWELTKDPIDITCPRCRDVAWAMQEVTSGPMPAPVLTAASVIANVQAALSLVPWVDESDPGRPMVELIRDAIEALVSETNNNAVNPQETT